jgi:hypothetical protein
VFQKKLGYSKKEKKEKKEDKCPTQRKRKRDLASPSSPQILQVF